MTVEKVASVLDVSKRTVYRMLKDGTLEPPIYLRAGSPRWTEDQVSRCINSLRAGPKGDR